MIFSGRKVLVLLSPLVLAILATGTAVAVTKSTVYVETQGDSESNVRIQSNSKSTNTTKTSSTTGRTDIVIECNGIKKEYHSDKVENVNLNCDDSISGTVKSQVNINNNTSPTAKIATDQISEEEKENINEEKKEIKEKVLGAKTKLGEERKDLFEQITQLIRNFFKNFHF